MNLIEHYNYILGGSKDSTRSAVASYSGPIFIPKDKENLPTPSHSYYNVPKSSKKPASETSVHPSSDYESISSRIKKEGLVHDTKSNPLRN